MVSKETKVDILVTPGVTIFNRRGPGQAHCSPIGTAASAFGLVIDNATKLQPFWMGIAVSVLVGIALTLPISSAAICSVLGLTGLAGGAAMAAAAPRWWASPSCPSRKTAGAVWSPRAWAPPCSRCPTL